MDPWSNPALANGTTLFAALVYPFNGQKGVDTSITFRWKKLSAANKYLFQLSTDPTFAGTVASDSTADTVKTITGLSISRPYYWRVQVSSAAGPGIWSDIWQFTTTVPLPTRPELGAVTQDPYPGVFRFHWQKTQYADQYLLQTSIDTTFSPLPFQSRRRTRPEHWAGSSSDRCTTGGCKQAITRAPVHGVLQRASSHLRQPLRKKEESRRSIHYGKTIPTPSTRQQPSDIRSSSSHTSS